ncbi:uncharacterized protein BO95DRAFT_444162 [Aspergillus brunneoviolaceus CBS 621.78]|uniref:Uncharacterized protein n=1 Tax=Aspergillus brunneoviolaceus CBS 621.78 TaxID=1450534 RepID=A0ACD1G503_9EURO|nr:hypothetical protein BO95DRAFT_444162 [Aspergillus brunneoviolaceus CBS 621.78]RAH44312.1 hypothetical protein BO95DRAFT_444162 [Aspergillus brunneoviolaceus CBS 621.78]
MNPTPVTLSPPGFPLPHHHDPPQIKISNDANLVKGQTAPSATNNHTPIYHIKPPPRRVTSLLDYPPHPPPCHPTNFPPPDPHDTYESHPPQTSP